MTKVKSKQKMEKQKVIFSIEAAEAKKVILMGDFNNWDPKTHPMKKDGNGVWKKTLMLPPNKYEYKFLIDGDWKEDPRNDQECPNCFGTVNSIFTLTSL